MNTPSFKRTHWWTQQQGVSLCTKIQAVSETFHCHPALTGGLLYKTGLRKDCDIVIYQRGDTKGVRPAVDWTGLWQAFEKIGLELNADFGYVKKCTYRGKVVDIIDPAGDSEYKHEELKGVS